MKKRKLGSSDLYVSEIELGCMALGTDEAKARSEIAIQYNLSFSAVASVVAGASSVDQIRENARASRSNPLTTEEIHLIQQITKANKYDQHR